MQFLKPAMERASDFPYVLMATVHRAVYFLNYNDLKMRFAARGNLPFAMFEPASRRNNIGNLKLLITSNVIRRF